MIDVWLLDLELAPSIPREAYSLLDERDRARLAEFRIGADRRRYAASRILLRRALSSRLGQSPVSWRFKTQTGGKVILDRLSNFPDSTDYPGIDFSISYSGSALVLAVSALGAVGVDLEQLPELNDTFTDEVDGFTEHERAYLKDCSVALRSHEALRLWTVKEAYAKRIGKGLEMDFTRIQTCSNPQSATEGDWARVHRFEVLLTGNRRFHLAVALPPFHKGAPTILPALGLFTGGTTRDSPSFHARQCGTEITSSASEFCLISRSAN